jgi:hypothetical protein
MDFVVSLIFFLILNSTIHKCIFNYVKRNRPCLNNNSFKLYYWYTRLSQKKPAQYLRGRHTHTLYVVIFFVTAVYTRTPVMFSQNFGYVSLYISTIFQLYCGGQLQGPGENHRPVASHWQTLSHNVVHLALIEIRTHISGDRLWLHR